MNLGVSHFAFDLEESFLEFLNKNNIKNIEVIFSKLDKWDNIDKKSIKNYHNIIKNYNLTSISTQSLFFNSGCDTLSERKKILYHVDKLIEFSKILGVKKMIFGSPSLRKKFDDWEFKLQQLFYDIDRKLEKTDIEFLIEPNAKIYQGEYFFKLDEIISFIKKNNYYNIRTMICTHNLILENENVLEKFIEYKDYIKHIHISELDLKPINDFEFHKKFSSLLKESNYNNLITYEIKKCDNIQTSILDFINIYKN